jgi:hypothetical protein
MKTAVWIAAAAAVLLIGAGLYFWTGQDAAGQEEQQQALYDYLQQAGHIRISKMEFGRDGQTIQATVLLTSDAPQTIDGFLNALTQSMATGHVETAFEAMQVFTPDYRVELACKSPAIIDFVFYDGANAACLRNRDCFFFAEFDAEGTDHLKRYFDQL